MKILNSRSLTYDDVNLIAHPQNLITSRKQVPIALGRIIVSPMDAVVGEKFAIEALKLGLTVCLPRFSSVDSQRETLFKIYDVFGTDVDERLFVSIGLNDIDRIKQLSNHTHVLIDVANGYLYTVADFARTLQDRGHTVMVGNVHTADGLNLYQNCLVRVGIGGGSVCQTSKVTGFTRGQITEIEECCDRNIFWNSIIGDGGIRDSGCAAKAFGAGASYVMMGGYFSKAEEAQNIIDGEYSYWGGASYKQQIRAYGEIKRHSEGNEVQIDKKEIKPLKVLVDELWGGISSAISYSGYWSLADFIGKGVFEIKHSK